MSGGAPVPAPAVTPRLENSVSVCRMAALGRAAVTAPPRPLMM